MAITLYPEGIANILSLHNVQQKHKITYDNSQGTGFVVHKADGTSCAYIPSYKGLFFSHVKGDIAHVLINTVERIKINTQLSGTLMPIKLD